MSSAQTADDKTPPRPPRAANAAGATTCSDVANAADAAAVSDVANPHVPRAVCARCRRPLSVCYCAHVPTLPTQTRVVLLQHPAEKDKAIGTARMAHLCLPNSTLHVGLNFANQPDVAQIVASDTPTYLLFPGDDTIDVKNVPRDQAITLVVVDGTWWQARKLLKLNPAVAKLPRVGFFRERPSEYRIRREPADFCLSTIEALAEVLNVLEAGPLEAEPALPQNRFDKLLEPFRAMVDQQIRFEREVASSRHQRAKIFPRPARRPTIGAYLEKVWPRLVCVQGEANAWPRQDPAQLAPEMVHWVAHRPATGERYEAIIAPRVALAPSTSSHIGVVDEKILAGISLQAWQQSWQAFLREDDLLVHWGNYYPTLAMREGLQLPAGRIDLRNEIRHRLRKRVGTIESCLEALGKPAAASAAVGATTNGATTNGATTNGAATLVTPRGKSRLATLVEIVQALQGK